MKNILETPRVFLREMNDDDLSALLKIITKHDGRPSDEEYAQKWLDWCKKSYQEYGFGHWAVVDKQTGEMIGSCGISMQSIDDEWKPEIGYHLRKDYHRQGLGKEIASSLRDYFFTHYDYDEVFSYMDIDNVASYKTAESIGMKFDHIFTSKYGISFRVYKITREEWMRR